MAGHPAPRCWAVALASDRAFMALPPACRLRRGRFDRLPPLESLFFCWPKRKVTQRKWPEELAASCWDKPERSRMIVAGHPWEATQRALRSAAQRARIAEDLKRSLAPHRPLLWLRSSRSYAMHHTSPSPLVGEGWGEGAGACGSVATSCFALGSSGPRMTAAGGWRKGRRVAAGMRPVFRQDTDVLSKNPATRTRTFLPKGRKARHPRCRFFWHCHHLGGYFSLGKQRKVTRPPAGGRKPAAGEPGHDHATNERKVTGSRPAPG